MKFYAVKKGHTTGIFDNWGDCQSATKGFSNPDFKGFSSREEAEAYLKGKDLWKDRVAKEIADGFLVAFVDGSFDKDLARYSYGVVFVLPDGTEKNICGYGDNQNYIDSQNIIGEIFGVINAIDWAIANGYEKIKIYHDYEGLAKWISGEWSAKSNASKMFVGLYKSKFEDVIAAEFIKVPGHSNVSYNEKADQLAKSALVDRKKIAIQGAHWYSIPYFSQDDFQAFADIIIENDSNISYEVKDYTNKKIYKFILNGDTVTVTLFKSGHKSLLVQGKNTYLFQVIATSIVELDDNSKVEQILGSAYRVNVNQDTINSKYKPIESSFPANYPINIQRLIKQSIINLNYYVECEDYSQYAFPALRALEGHIKYLIQIAGGTVNRQFNQFNKAPGSTAYLYTAPLTDLSKKGNIETCYNYYKSQRDTSFHYGDMLGSIDNTRIINTKEEADEIILKCINLINTQI